jgi:hypothetical protein
LLSFIAFGQLKHVRAFGYVPQLKAWIFYDVCIGMTNIYLAKGRHAEWLIHSWCEDCAVLELPVADAAQHRPLVRLGFWCVPAIKHLLRLRSRALRPDRLWRDCLQSGARIIHDRPVQPTHTSGSATGAAGPGFDRRPAASAGSGDPEHPDHGGLRPGVVA